MQSSVDALNSSHSAAPRVTDASVWALLVAFVFSIPVEAALIVPGLGSLSRVIGIILLCLVVRDLAMRGRVYRPGLAVALGTLFAAWAALTTAWSFNPQASALRSLTYFQLVVMLWTIVSYAHTRERCLALLQAYVLGVLFVAAFTVIEFRSINFAALTITDVRISAFGFNPNEQGLAMVAGLPAALYCLRRNSSTILRLANLLALVAGSIAVILTASRTAFLAMMAAYIGMLWMLADARLGYRIVAAALGAGIAAAAITVVPDVTWDRLATIGTKLQSFDLNNRLPAWRAGLSYFADRPLGGVGAGAFADASERVINTPVSSHNTFLGVLVETGLVGATIFACLLLHVARSVATFEVPLRRTFAAILVPMMIGMVVSGWDHRKVPWLFFGLAVALIGTAVSQSSCGMQGAK